MSRTSHPGFYPVFLRHVLQVYLADLVHHSRTSRHVALKVVKSDGHYTETALDEIQLLQRVVSSSPIHAGRCHVVGLVDDFRHDGPNGSHVCMVFEVLGENLLGLIKRYQHRGVPQHIVKQIAKQVLLGLDYLHTECRIIHTDLKPENVLICIEDVESVVQAELATCPAAVPTKLVGVPPSQGRLGNQTPRNDSMFIVGSQPLPSPSSSFSSSPMLDKHGFGMSKISGGGISKPGSATSVPGVAGSSAPGSSSVQRGSTADGIGNDLDQVKLEGDYLTWEKTRAPIIQQPGPSLLSQQMTNYPDMTPSVQTPGSTVPSTSATPSHTVITTPATTPDSGQELKISTSVGSTAPSIHSAAGKTPAAPAFSQSKIQRESSQTDETSRNITQPSDPPSEATIPLSSDHPSSRPERSDTMVTDVSSDAASTKWNNLQDQSPHHQPSDSSTAQDNSQRPQYAQHFSSESEPFDENQIAPVAGDPNMLPPPFPYDPISLERITVKIADLGNACWVDHHFTNDIQTRQYRCPEIILGTRWNQSVDMWSAASLFFELLTGDYLFDPQPGGKYDKDDDHMAQILELLGDMPKALALSGKYSHEIFTRKGENTFPFSRSHYNKQPLPGHYQMFRSPLAYLFILGELRHISRLRYWPLDLVLKEKYLMEAEEAELLSSFLMPMMHFYPEGRASAAEMVNHPWLKGVVVLGEEEMAEQARMRELEVDRLKALRNQSTNSSAAGSSSNTARNSTSSQGQPAVQGDGEADAPKGEGSAGGSSTSAKRALDDVMKLGPSVKGMVGMGRI